MSNKYVDFFTALTFLSNVTNSILINLIELHVTNASFSYTVHRKEAALYSCIVLYNLLVRGIYLNPKSCTLSGPINYDSERSTWYPLLSDCPLPWFNQCQILPHTGQCVRYDLTPDSRNYINRNLINDRLWQCFGRTFHVYVWHVYWPSSPMTKGKYNLEQLSTSSLSVTP